jgi:hypothetical protein
MIVLPLIRSFRFNFTSFYSVKNKIRNIGSVKITENNICVNYKRNTIHYDVSKLEKLEIHGSLYYEFNPHTEYLVEAMAKRRYTGKTKFILNFSDKSISINFQITTKIEYSKLCEVLIKWYKSQSFKIKEYHLGEDRMLLLNPHLSYEKIQEIKKELGIKSMYD